MFIDGEEIHCQKGFHRIETLSDCQELPRGARFLTNFGKLEVTYYAPGIIRLQIGKKTSPNYGLLVTEPEAMDTQVSEIYPGSYRLEASRDDTALSLDSSPLRFRLDKGEDILLETVTDRAFLGNLRWMPLARSNDTWMLSLALKSGMPVYGLGEKFASLNRRGQLVDSWNCDATTVNAERSYKNIPFAWSPEGWGILIHTAGCVTHGVGYPQWSHRSYILKVADTQLDVFLFTGKTPAEILDKYTYLTGKSPIPPRWSYGAWMSRAYYETAEEALDVAETLRERQIPSDVIVLDGRAWHKMETRFDFQWDQDRYPNPGAFVKTLQDKNFQLCLWEYPYISTRNPLFNKLAEKGYLLKDQDGNPYIHTWFPYPFDLHYPHLLPSGIIDMTNPEAYRWYRDAHKELLQLGVATMKTDYGESIPKDVVAHDGTTGEQLHNVYALLYNRCAYEATQEYGQKGALVWGRSGWIGSQRYPIQWGGDPQCDWEALAASIRGGLSWGMSGTPFYSHDIGGFSLGEPEAELYIRWAQAGVMCSHTRFHGLGRREPWVYGEKAETIVKRWLQWRYRLIPYLQACALDAHRTGMPVMRAMPLAFPQDRLSWNFEQQYLLGPNLLVVPVITPGGEARYYLPTGSWYDIWTGETFEGPAVFDERVPLEYIPVFGRAGSILPLGPEVEHTGELKPNVDLDEIWVFGQPEEGIDLPGLSLGVADGKIDHLPDEEIEIRYW
jgi:alpha-D-xyloside xylohydrolase